MSCVEPQNLGLLNGNDAGLVYVMMLSCLVGQFKSHDSIMTFSWLALNINSHSIAMGIWSVIYLKHYSGGCICLFTQPSPLRAVRNAAAWIKVAFVDTCAPFYL